MRIAHALFALFVFGCGPGAGSEDGGAGDGAASDGGVPGPDAPAPPMPPAAPAEPSRACPTGWTRTALSGCAPFETEPACTGATAAIPGTAACVAIGSPCPSGDFGPPPAAGRAVYVRAGAPPTGDGSMSAPFDTLARAIAAATSGTTILLSKGSHVGDVLLPGGVELRGACAAETTLSPSSPAPDLPTIYVSSGEVRISDLTITGDRPGVMVVGATATAIVRGVRIEDVHLVGMLAQGSRIEADEVIVRDVRPVGAMPGRGADAVQGGTLVLRRAMIEGASGGGTLLSSGAHAEIADVTYRDLPTRAITAQVGATALLERVAMLRVAGVAINANNGGTTLEIRDLAIDDVGVSGIETGRGVGLGEGASIEAAGLYVSNTGENGVFVTDEGSSATLSDVVFASLGGRGLNGQRGAVVTAERVRMDQLAEIAVLSSTGARVTVRDVAIHAGERGFRAQLGAELTVQRASVRDGAGAVAIAGSPETVVTLEDLDVENVAGNADRYGMALAVFDGSDVTVRRMRVRNTTGLGLLVHGAEARAAVEDVDIAAVAPLDDGLEGYGVLAVSGVLDATRLRVADCRAFGVGTALGARVTLRDLAVRGTRVEEATGLWGRGMSMEGPGDQIVIERGTFEDSVSVGVFAGGAGTVFTMTDGVIRGTTRRDCSMGTCVEEGGVGLVSYYGASSTLTSFLLEGNEVAGAQLGAGGEIDLHEGEVRGHPIGVSIQAEGYDIARLSDGVRYVDNDSNLDSTALPVPSETGVDVMLEEPPTD